MDAALPYFDTVIGRIVVAAQITKRKLCLRLDVPAVLQSVFAAVFSTQRHACIIKVTGDLVAVGIVNSKIIVHIADFKDDIQVMPFAADLGIIEADRLIAVVAAAAAVTAAAVSIAERRALITFYFSCIFSQCIIAQLVSSIFIFKAEFTVTADLAAVHPKPGAGGVITIVAQLTHTLEQLIVFCAPGMVVEGGGRKHRSNAGSRFVAGIQIRNFI